MYKRSIQLVKKSKGKYEYVLRVGGTAIALFEEEVNRIHAITKMSALSVSEKNNAQPIRVKHKDVTL